MVTDAPGAPLVGEKLVMAGVGNTVNVPALVTVMPVPLTKTEIVPVVAPTGTVTVSDVDVDPVTVARVPLKRTVLLAGVVLKLVPVMVTVAPTAPLVGEKLVMVGAGTTSKLAALVTVTPLDVTEMRPSAAPAGTVTTMVVALEEVTVALTPLKNCTTGEAPKLVPLMVMVAPTAPVAGVKPVIVGVGRTVKLEALATVTPLEVTEMGPVAAPAGTVTTMVVALAEVTVALIPLKN
jgi:hypothetical protein